MFTTKRRRRFHKDQVFVTEFGFSRPDFQSRNKEMSEFPTPQGALNKPAALLNLGPSLNTF